MYIRNAVTQDLPAIVNIYNQSIPSRQATADTEPVTVASRLDWYRNRCSNRPLWVAIEENEILGWLSFQNFYGRPAYQHTAEISIYVQSPYHRRGIGSRLLEQAIAQSPQLQLNTLLAFVFGHNQPSLNLFSRYGFSQWGYLPDIAELDNNTRSLVILGLKLTPSPSKY
ncbi:GNAT family N-acetyltransferase [Pleurocapsa sp. PCC 7319]|uniref:GNAT family N-acetyltransferase n=1 Tax=Pleurocapsa sp. PCC 7319 TaxID=118161 RepID=UPI0003493AF1|nr:GNAT family N-acetyltransferase [Pleurocapsa sp. PCC 7319]